MCLIATDFPLPEYPMMTIVSPSATSSVKPWSTFLEPNALWTFCREIKGEDGKMRAQRAPQRTLGPRGLRPREDERVRYATLASGPNQQHECDGRKGRAGP